MAFIMTDEVGTETGIEGKIKLGAVKARREAQDIRNQNIPCGEGKVTPEALFFARKTATTFTPRLPIFQGAKVCKKGQDYGGSNSYRFDLSLMPRMSMTTR